MTCPEYPYYIMLRSGDDVQMDLHDYACLSMPRGRPAAPERHRAARGRASTPLPPYTAALGDPGQRTCPNAKLGKRGASKEAVPGPRGIVKTWKS